MQTKGLIPRSWRLIKKIFLVLFVAQFLYIILLRWVDPPFTLTQLGSVLKGDGLKRDYVNYNQMSPYAKLAVISSEDQLFADHNGFDWKSIEKAMAYNKKKPNRIRGASTISQQVAKNVFLWQGRSWLRKALETYFTFMIELIWNKRRILEMYLNVSEMGRGIYGIQAASLAYFNKPASKLNRNEAAMIAGCLPNPKVLKVKPMSHYIATRHPVIVRQMNYLQGDDDIMKIIR